MSIERKKNWKKILVKLNNMKKEILVKYKWFHNNEHLEEIRKGLTKYLISEHYQGSEEPLKLLNLIEQRIEELKVKHN